MAKSRRIAILIPANFGYNEGVLSGVIEYASSQQWSTLWMDPEPHLTDRIKAWRPDGAIIYLYNKPQAEEMTKLGIPLVNISGNLHVPGIPRVTVQNETVAQMAVDYFWNRGYRQFACVSTRRRWYHRLRDEAFVNAVKARGGRCMLFEHWYDALGNLRPSEADPFKALRKWLETLPRPIAMFAVQDSIAVAVIEAANEVGIRVPEDMPVLGADNSTTLCRLANPNVSSIELALEDIGKVAARTLDEILDGRKPKEETQLLPPVRVVERRSTEVIAISDHDVSTAMRFILSNPDKAITVADILGKVLISRRLLEQKFKKELGYTPLVAIHQAHVQRAMQLLAETDLPMPVVAERSGFSDAEHMCKVFRLRAKQTPTAYRRRVRYRQA